MPEWSTLNINDVMTGLWVLVVGLLGAIGARAGVRRGAPSPPPRVEIAGDVVVIKSMELLTNEVGALAGTMIAHRKAIEAHHHTVDEHREAIEESVRVAQQIHDVGGKTAREMTNLHSQIKELKDELWRQSEREEMRRNQRRD